MPTDWSPAQVCVVPATVQGVANVGTDTGRHGKRETDTAQQLARGVIEPLGPRPAVARHRPRNRNRCARQAGDKVLQFFQDACRRRKSAFPALPATRTRSARISSNEPPNLL
jgi:hypothetical protein